LLGGSSQTFPGGRDLTDNVGRRSRWRAFVSFAVLLALVSLLVPVFPTATHVRARFDQIQNGMTEQRVEEVLGVPRRVYDTARSYSTMTAVGTGSGRSHLSWWYFPDCAIEVGFDEDGRVSGKRIEPPPTESLLEKAVRWCKRTFSSPSP
jgi:hypothetical protein